MVPADFSGSFLNAAGCPDGTVVTIVGKPTVEDKEGQFGPYSQTNIEVEFDGKKKIYTPDNESGIRMVTSWGSEMDKWVGKQFKIEHAKKKVKGETKVVVDGYPVE